MEVMDDTKTTPKIAQSIAQSSQRSIDRQIEEILSVLRRTIDNVERAAHRGQYGDVVKEITWAVANCDLGGLLGRVAELTEWQTLAQAKDRIEQ